MTVEEMFKPLFLLLKSNEKADEIVGQYMFMYTENNNFYYKHFATRDYIVINSSGKLIDGHIIDPEIYF